MLLNEKKFYRSISNYYDLENYNGAERFLEDKEQELRQSIAVVMYEQGRLFQYLERWGESLAKYEEAKEIMEKNDMTDRSVYEALLENVKLVKEKL